MRVTLTNYRCFPNGATLDLASSFTALVGVNNSGKSSLLRLWHEIRQLLDICCSPSSQFPPALRGIPQALNARVSDAAGLFSKDSRGDLEIIFDVAADRPGTTIACSHVPDRLTVTVSRQAHHWTATIAEAGVVIRVPADETLRRGSQDGRQVLLASGSTAFADITTLVESVSVLRDSLYLGSFRNAINAGGSNYYDIDVGQRFIQTYRDWSSGPRISDRDAALELQRVIKGMFGYGEFTIVPNSDATSLVCSIDGRSYSLAELGSGLAQFVLVLANVAVKRPRWVLIDEPELNLHPSLQRDFLLALALFTDKVVFATHNLGLALNDADRIYSVVRKSQGVSEVHDYRQTPRLAEFLGELSFAGYRELGFDTILLVEGPTEVKAFRHFLNLYGKGHRVVLVQLGGSSMINGKRKEELAELFHVCPKVATVVDSDRIGQGGAANPAAVAFAGVCGGLHITCLVLERFATENYLSDAAVKAEFGPSKAALGAYEKIDEPAHWKKDANWKIARHMVRADLDGTDLGLFLANL